MRTLTVLAIGLLLLGCSSQSNQSNEGRELPIYGNRSEVNGETQYHTIPDFSFVNQDGETITQAQIFGKKIFVADFFFTSCTTICPAMKGQMMRVYEEFLDDDRVVLLSHSIDPEYDTPEVLAEFAEKLGVSSHKWHFLSGVSQEAMFAHGQQGYIVTATADDTVPDGILHSGAFILVDLEGRIRGIYDGTLPIKVDQLIADMHLLLGDELNGNE